MQAGQKLNKSQIRSLPQSVADRVLELQKRYRTRSCTFHIEDPANWKLYLAEGETYSCWDGKEKEFNLKMQSQHSLHAGGHQMSHKIGYWFSLPQGSWVVRFALFLGKPIIDVHHVGLFQLA